MTAARGLQRGLSITCCHLVIDKVACRQLVSDNGIRRRGTDRGLIRIVAQEVEGAIVIGLIPPSGGVASRAAAASEAGA